ncbi:hypothetical protein D3C84_1232990 [compost metagenome]
MHFDPTVLIAVDLFALGAGDHGGLAAEDARFGVFQGRAVEHVPRGGEEAVAVALVEVVLVVSSVAGHRLF